MAFVGGLLKSAARMRAEAAAAAVRERVRGSVPGAPGKDVRVARSPPRSRRVPRGAPHPPPSSAPPPPPPKRGGPGHPPLPPGPALPWVR